MNKKFIAILTALALVVTLVAPVGVQEASAASKNKVDRVVTVNSNDDLYNKRYPYLEIEVDDSAGWQAGERFRVEIPSSAEWKLVTADVYQPVYNGTTVETNNAVKLTQITDQVVEVETLAFIDKGHYFKIPLKVDIRGGSGELKVTINPLDSRVSGGSYTFAVVQSGKTVATAGSKKTVARGSGQEISSIIIDETVAGALAEGKTHGFTLRLPNNFEWDSTPEVAINLPGGSISDKKVEIGTNKRDLIVSFKVDKASESRGSITIKNPTIKVTRDAKFGDVTVSITSTRGDISSQSGLVVAEYADYDIKVEVEEVKEFLSGYLDDDYVTAKITVEELVENSLANGRVIEFTLPSWVKIAKKQTNGDNKKDQEYEEIIATGLNGKIDIYGKGSKFEVRVNDITGTGKNKGTKKFELEIPLTAKGTESGDVELEISGAGIPTQKLTIAKFIAPVTAEVKVADVRLGVQGQPAPEIIITENVAGALRQDKKLELQFVDADGFTFDSFKVEVIEGDLEIDEDNTKRTNDNKTLTIAIDSESTEPSKLRVYDIKMTVNRVAPEGPVKLDIRGDAVVNNNDYYDDLTSRVARFDFANVITPAPGETRATVVFTIDSNTYTVIEAGQEIEKTMDVAPYIKDSRTFLPVFFVAQALGVSENNVVWEPHSKTVTIFKGDRVAQMQIGSNVLLINGTPVQMDTAPEIKDGRTMLPVFFVGQALGANVEWDADARTVTVTQ